MRSEVSFLGQVFGISSVCPSIMAKRRDQLIVMIVCMTFFIPRLSDKCIGQRFFLHFSLLTPYK